MNQELSLRVQVADYCERAGLEVAAALRTFLHERSLRFSCEEHLVWLEGQVEAELHWRSLNERFSQLGLSGERVIAKVRLITASNRCLPPARIGA